MANTSGRRIGRPWREDPVILARLIEIERRHLAGDHNITIARALNLAEKTIRDDLKRLQQLWLERTGGKVEELRARTVQELLDVKRRALAAAEFDEQAERAVLYGEVVTGPDGQPRIVQRDEKRSAQFRGNKAAALTVARQAVMDAAKVLGIVVDKVSPTNERGESFSLAELALLARTGTRE